MKNIIEQLKKELGQKERVTFYLEKDVIKKFKLICAENNIKQSDVLDYLLKNFLKKAA